MTKNLGFGLALAGAAVFAASMSAQAAPSITTGRTPYQWPSFLGVLDQPGFPLPVAIANADGPTDLISSRLLVDYVGGGGAGKTYDVDVFQLTCVFASPAGPAPDLNKTSNYNLRQECPNAIFGNALVQAGFSLKTP